MIDPPGIYPDGLAFPGYVAAVQNLHPACDFTFRPMISEEVRALKQAAERAESWEQSQAAIDYAIGSRLATWSLKGPNGAVVKPDPASFRRINPQLADKISGIVQGYRPSDLKPDGTQLESGEMQLRESEKN